MISAGSSAGFSWMRVAEFIKMTVMVEYSKALLLMMVPEI